MFDYYFIGPLCPNISIMGHSFVSETHLSRRYLHENFPNDWKIFTYGIMGGNVEDALNSLRQQYTQNKDDVG